MVRPPLLHSDGRLQDDTINRRMSQWQDRSSRERTGELQPCISGEHVYPQASAVAHASARTYARTHARTHAASCGVVRRTTELPSGDQDADMCAVVAPVGGCGRPAPVSVVRRRTHTALLAPDARVHAAARIIRARYVYGDINLLSQRGRAAAVAVGAAAAAAAAAAASLRHRPISKRALVCRHTGPQQPACRTTDEMQIPWEAATFSRRQPMPRSQMAAQRPVCTGQ